MLLSSGINANKIQYDQSNMAFIYPFWKHQGYLNFPSSILNVALVDR